MKKIIYKSLIWILVIPVFMIACKEEDPTLGAVPTATDVEFTFAPTAVSDNIIKLTNTSPGFLKKWDFGNGQSAEGSEVTVTYPFAGDYEVTLTVYTSGGSLSSKQTINIAETDLSLLSPIYSLLTGGPGSTNGKTWVIASTVGGHMGVGPPDAASPIWWSANPGDKSDTGLYDDKYTFKLGGFKFVQQTNGDVYVNNAQGANFPGAYPNKGDQTAPYTAPDNLTWSITTNAAGHDVINIVNPGFIGYYTGVSSYEILSASESEISIKFMDASNAGLAWFHKLVPDGYVPPVVATTIPVDFEGAKPPFNGFGGTAYDVVANPSATGINTSAKVGKYVKGFDGSWAGIETPLSAKLDFSTNTVIKYKVYSPVAGKALFKLETQDGSAAPVEVFANVTKVNEWEELTFNFSGTASNVYNKIAMFLDFDNNNGGTFYIDDIRQAFVPAVLTEADLTGGSSKTWILKPAAGSFGVGPAKGSDAWWPNGADVSGDRPCLFNDEFIFKTGGVYEYDANGDIFGEAYMGTATNGCQPESNLPANAAAWGSKTHAFTFTPASGGNPATIKVTGTGAFIALPKAYNGGEYAAAPPTTDGSVTYEVLNYVKNGSTETLTITVDVTNNASGFWTFVLIAQ
jgi:hypothetical protein